MSRQNTRPVPVVTWTLIGICVLVWAVELTVPGFIDDIALSAAAGREEPWRFLTSAFAHAENITHIGFNMWALWAVGRSLEGFLGRARYIASYLLSALAGSTLFVVMASPVPNGTAIVPGWYDGLVGASGAIFGLFGILLVVQRRLGGSTRPLWIVLGLNVALVFFIPDIAWQAHVGGFLAGLVTGVVLFEDTERVRRGHRPMTWWALAGLLAVMVILVVLKYLITPVPG
ncbi:rhomboid family intramembrane serine protease [Acidipropionibacterium jensenii]|uniref:rhomboid family intramembrane serine protease n=1 Tax=Acidipropionibacterium jensenii TaxID=1749 RepID=UPI000BC3068A|nr:rhomboid family intramembrane serine protease [Acidipropionibacterium jensenii]AZZ41247.1 rhomboid family intramembrane serine protease [Acidipropionibacterium jensenii]